MATTGIINATNIVILADYARIASLVNAELSLSRDMIDGTTKDSEGWNQVQAGKLSWEMSGEGKLHFDETKNMAYVFDMIKNKTKFKVLFGVEETDDAMYIGDAYFTSISGSAGVEDASTYSFAIQGTGSIRKLNVLYTTQLVNDIGNEFAFPSTIDYRAIKLEWKNNSSNVFVTVDHSEKVSVGDEYVFANSYEIDSVNGIRIDSFILDKKHNLFKAIVTAGSIGELKIVIYGN